MSKIYFVKSFNNTIEQYKLNILLSLEAKKKAFLTKELIEKIRNILSKKEYNLFINAINKITYDELETLFYDIYKKKCVQKVC